ncbi:MAG: VTT domain-containing protein [Desulfotignum sp.]
MKYDSSLVKKLFLLILIAGMAVLFFAMGLQEYLTLEFVKTSQQRFQEIYSRQPVRVIALFVALYIPVIALNLPGATILGLAAGALFGALTGTVIISFASTIGASLACLVSRYLFRDWVQKNFGSRLERINEGIRKEGAFYLFSMRLIPVIPFFVINMVMGLTPMRLWTFYWVSQLGMLPGTFIYVNAGSQIARIDSLAGIVSPGLIGSLALLGLFPLAAKKLLAAVRRGRSEQPPSLDTPVSDTGSPEFIAALTRMQKDCTDCGACKSQCAFLKEYGTPAQLLKTYDFRHPDHQLNPFECSLCNLCKAVCPEKLDPGHLFFLARKEAVSAGRVDLSRYKGLLAYEKKGNSPLFTWYGLPKGCDTVFFPGCTLPGTRSRTTWQMFTHLQKTIPSLGVVLDCCNKISHDLGRQDHFESLFTPMHDFLINHHIQKVLVACPNCFKMFDTYGDGITVETVWQAMDRQDLPDTAKGQGDLRVHDPCPLRQETGIQDAVRSLVSRMGMAVEKIHSQKHRTLCCGEGGSVGCVRPDLARNWGKRRQSQAGGRTLVTYCAGCAGYLARLTPTIHLADLIFDTQNILSGRFKVARAPFTYLHRLRLKNRFKKHLAPAVQQVRQKQPMAPEYLGKTGLKTHDNIAATANETIIFKP